MDDLVYLNENKENGFDGYFKFFPEDFKVIEINTSGELCVHGKTCQSDKELEYEVLPKSCYTLSNVSDFLSTDDAVETINEPKITQKRRSLNHITPPLPFIADRDWCRAEMIKIISNYTFQQLQNFSEDVYESMDNTLSFGIEYIPCKTKRRTFFQCFFYLFGHLNKIILEETDNSYKRVLIFKMSNKFAYMTDLIGKNNARLLRETYFELINSSIGHKRVFELKGVFSEGVVNQLLLFIKKRFHSASLKVSSNDDGQFSIKLFRKPRFKSPDVSPDSKFTEFVLFKNDIESFIALTQLASYLGVKGDQISIAGIKDKKSLSWQNAVVTGMSETEVKEKLTNDCSSLNKMRITDVKTTNARLRAGQNYGNYFIITLRNIKKPCLNQSDHYETDHNAIKEKMCTKEEFEVLKKKIEINLKEVQENGFINYFGPQRVGIRLADDYVGNKHATDAELYHGTAIGRYMLKRQWKPIVHLILTSQFFGDQKNYEAGEHALTLNQNAALQIYKAKKYLWETGDVEGAYSMFPSRSWVERSVLKSLRNVGIKKLDFSQQNKANEHIETKVCSLTHDGVSECRTSEPDIYEEFLYLGILRNTIPKFTRNMGCNSYCSLVWNKVASERIKQLGPLVVEGDFVAGNSMSRNQPGLLLPNHKVHEVTSEDVRSKRFSLSDVVVSVPGTTVPYPPNLTHVYKELLGVDGLWEDREVFCIEEFNWESRGLFRKLIQKPTNFSFEWKKTCEISPQSTKYLRKNNQNILFVPNRPGLKFSFSLPGGCYATSMLREITKRGMRC